VTSFQNELFREGSATAVEPEVLVSGASEQFSGLAQFDMIDQLLGLFQQREQAIEATAEFIENASRLGVMGYFIDGMRLVYGPEYRYSIPTDTAAAKAVLRVEYWNRLLNEAQIFDVMPAAKRELARKQFSGMDCPPFDESTVRPTIQDLLHQRQTFFAERVDGVFRGLSNTHITNSPAGFSKKMILSYVFSADGYLNSNKAALISDLRGIVGRLTGRGEPSEYGTRQLLDRIYRTSIGKKVEIDGGAFSVTVYRVGTAHFEVAPEVAAELNSILAALYPLAIPAKFRTPPKKRKVGSFDMKFERLPMAVIDLLSNIERRSHGYTLSVYSRAKEAVDQTIRVIEEIGGRVTTSADKSTVWIQFDYEPRPVLDQLIYGGVIPEQTSHQFYPTRSLIGEEAAKRLNIRPGLKYCEPQAGTGDLAQFLPKESTVCIELAQVRAKVLEAKGFTTVQADFLAWAEENSGQRFDGILMNPPFSKQRAFHHLEAAASLLASDGTLVAILPASMINTTPLSGFDHDWSQVFEDQFEGTSVRVAILTAQRLS
jgi:hypothetical protein